MSICLNADLGEIPGPDGRAIDAGMLAVVTRCNVACGGHAGDAATMRETIRRACENRVQVGVHPSYPDTEHFGRRSLKMPASALAASLSSQINQLLDIAAVEGSRVVHLKPHGALYNDAAQDLGLSEIIVAAAADAGLGEILGPPNSALQMASNAAGMVFVAEGFADRTYESDGTLTPRHMAGAVIEDAGAVVNQALSFAREGAVTSRGGERLILPARTICLHSDTPGAADHARAIREGLEAAGVMVQA